MPTITNHQDPVDSHNPSAAETRGTHETQAAQESNDDVAKNHGYGDVPDLVRHREVLNFTPSINGNAVSAASNDHKHHDVFAPASPRHATEMMGPILRRKKVVSMPLGTTRGTL